jgi:DNA-binding NtrC family response regulator
MQQRGVFALLAANHEASLEDLKVLLKSQAIETWSARSCEEVERLLDQTHPDLIFTDERLSDGTWIDILNVTEKSSVPTNVIVVGKSKDIGLYLSTMDYGAFDFIVPPFEPVLMAHVVRVAAEDVRHRRKEQAVRTAAA